ncbi:MAG: type II secretion system F family protein, partial [Candidatus Binataceae bacterium]
AGLQLRLAELLFILAALFVGALALALTLGRDLPVAMLAAAAVGLAPIGFVRWRRARRTRAFLLQLPFALDLIKSSLEAGHSLNRGLQVMVAEFADPLRGEFRTALEQTRIGLPIARALEEMLRRVPEADLRLLVIAVKINHEAGASLARIVGRLAEVVRMRQRVRLQIRALTAQSRLGGYIVGALPIIVLGLFSLIQPAYAESLFTDPAGVRILKLALAMEALAVLTIRQMLKLKD